MKLSEILNFLEDFAPPALQESYDNSGLITGHREMDVTGILVALDCLETVIDEAIDSKCNLVVAHHPIVFSGLKKINGKNYVERVIIKAIKNDIAIYAIHTNLDNVQAGVNAKIGEKLGLKNLRILSPKSGLLRKLVTFCPVAQAEQVRSALFEAGAGRIGNYDECSFSLPGNGTFRGNDSTNPFAGKKGQRHTEAEERIETIFPVQNEKKILKALLASHPYEEVAYDIYPLSNQWKQVGSGMIGELENAIPVMDFLESLKTSMKARVVRYTPVTGKMISKVAICGGSGSFLLPDAMAAGADVFVTADFKYHQFFDGEGKIVIADIGHFETEQFTIELLVEILKQKFPTFAVRQTGVITNPITYLT
jgi:dinuclear metal center YbgI/SA1388 family protein